MSQHYICVRSLIRLFTVQPFQLFCAFVASFFQLFVLVANKFRLKINKSSRKRAKEQPIMEVNYEKYAIVSEQCLSINVPNLQSYNSYSVNNTMANSTKAWIHGNKWEFSVIRSSTSQFVLKIALLEIDNNNSPITVQFVFWQWHRGKQIYILQNMMKIFSQTGFIEHKCNGTNSNATPSDGHFYAIVRILQKRELIKDPCPSFGDSEDVTLRVGPELFVVSRHYLMSVSPVFFRMFMVEMREKVENEVNLEEITSDEFRAFLEAICPRQIHPNPKNVGDLIRLADRFQVDFLRQTCEMHLINCVEIPIMERLLFAEYYRLEKLKNYILKSLTGAGLREFYEENEQELNLLSKELLIQLTKRICSSVKIGHKSLCQNCQMIVSE